MSPASITLVLDNLRSCHNVGSIIRTADGFGQRRFVFLGTTPHPRLSGDPRLAYQSLKQTRQIAKTALGAEQNIQGRYYAKTQDFLQVKNDWPIVCLEQTPDGRALKEYRLKQPIYLVVGNEIDGVSEELLGLSSERLTIPMSGDKESFNVAVAAGIALYQLTL